MCGGSFLTDSTILDELARSTKQSLGTFSQQRAETLIGPPTPQQHQYFHAAPMYHETITVASGLLINEQLAESRDLNWRQFAVKPTCSSGVRRSPNSTTGQKRWHQPAHGTCSSCLIGSAHGGLSRQMGASPTLESPLNSEPLATR
jgi:hypothetical protein